LKPNCADDFSFSAAGQRGVALGGKVLRKTVPGLGFDFLKEVRLSIQRIVSHPEAWTPLEPAI
jgi:hypothetical protein